MTSRWALVVIALAFVSTTSCRQRDHVEDNAGPPTDSVNDVTVAPQPPPEETPRPEAIEEDLGADVVALADLSPNHLYPGGRAPIGDSPFRPLPLGSIIPRGWLRTQLDLLGDLLRDQQLAVDPEFSVQSWNVAASCKDCGPAALRGLVAVAYSGGDDKLKAAARAAVRAILKSQDGDGWLGPRSLRGSLDSRPNELLVDALMIYFSATGDTKVLSCLQRYYGFLRVRLLGLVESEKARLDLTPHVAALAWLYNRVPNSDLLNAMNEFLVAEEGSEPDNSDFTTRATKGVAHYRATANPAALDIQSARTVGATLGDTMRAILDLSEITAAGPWSDRAEHIALNDVPSAFSADFRFAFDTAERNRVRFTSDDAAWPSRGLEALVAWPLFTSALWKAGPGDGVVAMSYAPCEVRAVVGDDEGTSVTIRVDGAYPFEETTRITLSTPRPAAFPLILRLPGWCKKPTIQLNQGAPISGQPGTFIALQREWHDGDDITLRLPMHVVLNRRDDNAIAVELGPLEFCLKLEEKYRKTDDASLFPRFEATTSSRWNYALLVKRFQSERNFRIRRRPGVENPYSGDTPSIELLASARPLSSWLDASGPVPQSPVLENRLSGPPETVTLVPYGATRLRVASFPWTCP